MVKTKISFMWGISRYFVSLLFIMPCTIQAEEYGYIPGISIALGQGFNPISPNQQYRRCITGNNECQLEAFGSVNCLQESEKKIVNEKSNSKPSPGTGMTTSFKIKQINSKYEFFRELRISASVSGSYGAFSGSAKFNYFSLDDISKKDLTWIISATTDYGVFGLSGTRLTADIDSIADNSFSKIELCGPQYVSRVRRGVTAVALFKVREISELHKKKVEAELKASYAGIGGSGKYKEAVETALEYGQMEINVYTIGGHGMPGLSGVVRTNPSDLDYIKQVLASYVRNQSMEYAAITGFSTQGLGMLIGDPTIETNYGVYLDYLDYAMVNLDKAKKYLKNVNEVLLNPKDYSETEKHAASEISKLASCATELILTELQKCRIYTETKTFYTVDGRLSNDAKISTIIKYGGVMNGSAHINREGLDLYLSDNDTDILSLWNDDNSKLCKKVNVANSELMSLAKKRTSIVDALRKKKEAPYINSVESVSACSTIPHLMELWELNNKRILPFQIRHWYDLYGENLYKVNVPENVKGVFIEITGQKLCERVRSVAMSSAKDNDILGFKPIIGKDGGICQSNDDATNDYIRFYFPMDTQSLQSGIKDINVIVTMNTRNTYNVYIPGIVPAYIANQ